MGLCAGSWLCLSRIFVLYDSHILHECRYCGWQREGERARARCRWKERGTATQWIYRYRPVGPLTSVHREYEYLFYIIHYFFCLLLLLVRQTIVFRIKNDAVPRKRLGPKVRRPATAKLELWFFKTKV